MSRPSSEKGAIGVGSIVFLAAASWPWGAYQEVYYGQGVFSLALGGLGLLFVRSWAREGRPGVPFDLLWPILVLVSTVTALWGMGNDVPVWRILAGSVAFLLGIFGGINQVLIFRVLALSIVSAGCVGFLTVLAKFNWVFPTFFGQHSTVVAAGPKGLVEGLLVFTWSSVAVFPLILGWRHIRSKCILVMLVLAAACCGIALFHMLGGTFGGDWSPEYGVLAFPTLPLILLVFYLGARMAARVFILKEPTGAGARCFLACSLLPIGLLYAWAAQVPSTGMCFCMGLVAALGIPSKLQNNERIGHGWAWLVLPPVLVTHAFILFPGDARDYVEQAERRTESEGQGAAYDFLNDVLRRYPGEARARYELACLELNRGGIDAAVAAFTAATRESRSCIVPKPDARARDAFLDQVGEKTSDRPGICLERCLVAVGRTEEAVALLEKRVGARTEISGDREPLRQALRTLLGIAGKDDNLCKWSGGMLVAALNLCGSYCQSIQAPEAVSRDLLPLVLAGKPVQGGRCVMVFYPGGQSGKFWRMNPCTGLGPGEGISVWLDPVNDEETGEWFVPLAGVADVVLGSPPMIAPIEDATLDCGPGTGEWAVLSLLP